MHYNIDKTDIDLGLVVSCSSKCLFSNSLKITIKHEKNENFNRRIEWGFLSISKFLRALLEH